MVAGDVKIIQAEHKPRAAVVLDGTQDWVEIDAFTVAQVLAADTKGTFTAWIKVSDWGSYCVISSGDDNIVEHLHLGVNDGAIVAQCKVNTVMQWDIISTNDGLITPDKWHHIAITHNGTRPNLFHNGLPVTVTDTVSTDLTAWYSVLTGGDKGAIGVLDMNSTETLNFDGGISDVKYWDKELSYAEMVEDGNGQTVSDHLIAHWIMEEDEAIEDESGYDGTVAGNAYTDPAYSDFTNKAHLAWVAAGDIFSITANGGQLTLLHVEGV